MIRKNPSPQTVLLFLLLGQPALYAPSYVMMADSALAAQASVIVVGRILESQTGFSEEPVTRYSVQVEELLKGTLTEDPIRVDVPGGLTSEGIELRIFGAPRFGLEDRILLFLEPPQDGSYGILQLMLGAFQEVRVLDQTLAVRNLSEAREVIAGLSGSVTRNQSKPPRNFQAFTRWLRDYSSGITRDEDYYIEPDPDIQLMIDRFTLTKSTDDFVRWSLFDTNTPRVGWLHHNVGQPGLLNAGQAEFEAALDAWTDDPDTNVQYVHDGGTNVTKGLTGVDEFNTILFEDPNGRIADSYDCEAGGVLALAGIWLGGGTETLKDQEFVTITAADIAVQDGAECVMGVSANAAAVFTHELGHPLGLDHSCDDDGTPKCDAWGYDQAIMRATAHLDGRGAALSQDDRAAISFLYGPSLDGPGDNQLPAAGAGSDLKVSVGSVVTLQGSGSDPDGDSLTFGWEQTSGPAVSLEEANTANSSFTALDVQQETVLTFRFTVEDGRGGADVDDLTVTIQPFGIFLPVSLDTDHPLFQNTFMGAAIVNLLGQANQVLLTALDAQGNEKSSRELDTHLPPLGQRAILTSDFFSEELGATKINAQGQQGPIQGFFMSGDNALRKLDGIGGELEGAIQLFFPLARHTGDTETTLIFLFNPNATVNAEVELSLYTQQGTLSAEESTTLAPLGSPGGYAGRDLRRGIAD